MGDFCKARHLTASEDEEAFLKGFWFRVSMFMGFLLPRIRLNNPEIA